MQCTRARQGTGHRMLEGTLCFGVVSGHPMPRSLNTEDRDMGPGIWSTSARAHLDSALQQHKMPHTLAIHQHQALGWWSRAGYVPSLSWEAWGSKAPELWHRPGPPEERDMTLCCVPSRSPGLLCVAVGTQVLGGGASRISVELGLPCR